MKTEKQSRLFGGFSAAVEGSAVVVGDVLRGSPAYRAKLKVGDAIASINGRAPKTVRDISAAILTRNKMKIARGRRTHGVSLGTVNLLDERDVASLLFGKGDRVPGTSVSKFREHCDDNCDCVDGGFICERWYTFEGEGPNGGVLMTIHCVSWVWDSGEFKTVKRPEKTRGPLEYF